MIDTNRDESASGKMLLRVGSVWPRPWIVGTPAWNALIVLDLDPVLWVLGLLAVHWAHAFDASVMYVRLTD